MNNPRKPLEASGTSGMKAAINGVPHLSIGDGWWAEGFTGANGWVIDGGVLVNTPFRPALDAIVQARTRHGYAACAGASSRSIPDNLRSRKPLANASRRRRSL